jgi:predicted  nucleic acid-binding Zn-ribbon protein
MSGALASEARDAWIEKVLGAAPQAMRKSTEESRSDPLPPFQIFVKSTDGVTLTLSLPERENTLIGDLLVMVENRTGIGWDQQYLATGTKPVNRQHANLPVAEYGIQPNQTLMLQGRLKGGFGERAAIAETVLKGITHGNVLGDIHQTKGESKALKDFSRMLTRRKNSDGSTNAAGDEHLNAIVQEAERLGLATQGKNKWLSDNLPFIKAIGTTKVQAGNCGDYTQVVYSELMTKTTGQTVYQVVMKKPYDHQFVVTSPTNWDTSIADLANDQDAMVADAWWANTICTFTKFVAGTNPYGEPVTASNLEIVRVGAANGKPFPKKMADFVAARVDKSRQKYQATIKKWADQNHLKTTALEDATALLERLGTTMDQLEPKLDQLEVEAEELDKDQQALTKEIMRLGKSLNTAKDTVANCEATMSDLATYLLNASDEEHSDELQKSIDQATAQYRKAVDELVNAIERVQQDERDLVEVKRQLDQVNQEWFPKNQLVDAGKKYQAAEANLPGSFGDVRKPWASGMDDKRTPQEIFDTVILSFKKGGAENFKNEVGRLSDKEFTLFWTKTKQFKEIVTTKVPDLQGRALGLGLK